jgi:hypothetical protein
VIACVAAQNGSLLRRQSGILFNEENERGGETFMTRKICRAVVAPSTRRAIGQPELVGLYRHIGVHQGLLNAVLLVRRRG